MPENSGRPTSHEAPALSREATEPLGSSRASSAPTAATARIAAWIALPFYLALVARFAFVCDDAYISFRYARHLVEGKGLVFNAGEPAPVEGYSNLLWVLWSAPWIAIGVDPGLAACATSIVAGVVLLRRATRHAVVRFDLALPAAVATSLFLATLPSFTVWSTSGLETVPFALAVFATFDAASFASPSWKRAAAWAIVATTLRADGAAWAIAALACGLVAARRESVEERARARRVAAACVIAVLVAVLATTAFRWLYFHELVPNTARVKADLASVRWERGWKYVATWAGTLPAAPIALVAGVVFARGAARRTVIACAALFAFAVLYAAWLGGDFMPFGRYLVPAAPFVAVALGAALARASRATSLACGAIAAASFVAASFDVVPLPASTREALHFRWNEPHARGEAEMWSGMRERAESWRLLGRALARATKPGESIVLGNIGAVGYECELTILDQFGLVDREVAREPGARRRASPGHDKGQPIEFFLARNPTYLAAWIGPAKARASDVLPDPTLERLRLEGRAEVEDVTIDEHEAGFREAMTLRLVRYRPR